MEKINDFQKFLSNDRKNYIAAANFKCDIVSVSL